MKKRETIVGQFFLSYPNKTLCWQGQILAEQTSGVFLVQLYDWFAGNLSGTHLVPIQRMVDEQWDFFKNKEDWLNAGSSGFANADVVF